jgi:calcium-dependent protein kinase
VAGVQRFVDKQNGKVVVVDGLPPNEVLTGNDPKFPNLPTVATDEEGFVLEEDLASAVRIDLLAKRVNEFKKALRVLVTVQLEAPADVIHQRVRAKNELPAEEPLNLESLKEIIDSWRLYEKIAQIDDVVLNGIPRCLTFNTQTSSIASIGQVLKSTFKRKIIMLRGYRELDKTISLFCWKNQLFYLDFHKVLYSADERLDELGDAVRKGKIDHHVKISLLKQAIKSRGLRDKIIVIGGYECDPDLEFESAFEELVLFEKEIGEISILVNVLNHLEDVQIEQLPVRRRLNPALDKSKEEKQDKDSDDNSEDEDIAPKTSAVPVEDTEVPMWNHYMKSGFSKLFHNFKGERAHLVEFKVTNYGAVKGFIEVMQNCLATPARFNVQVILGRDSEEFLIADLGDLNYPKSRLLREELPLDTRDLGNVTGRVNEVLTNRRAADFYKQAFIGLTCSFSVFWEKFLPFIEAEKWKDSKELKSAVKTFIDINKNGYISVEELNRFFDAWETPEKRAEIAIKSQSKPKKTGNFPENSLFLIVESSTPDPATQAITFKRGDTIEISPEGAVNSLRGGKDGYVYFGKSSKRAKNDIEFSSADTRMNFLHFLIRCKRKGYFLVDNGGKNGVKVRVTDKPVQLFPDFMLKIGPHSCRVVSISAPTPRRDDSILTFQIKNHPVAVEGEPELSLEFFSEELKGLLVKFEGDKKRIVIGSSKDCDVCLAGLDNLHSIIELRSPGWCIMDQHSSTGTFVYVNTWDRFSSNAPSKQIMLKDQVIIAVPGTEFKVVPKPDFEQVMTVSPDPSIRQDRFRALYRMGKYLKPGTDFKEFEATHKPSRDKVSVQVVNLQLKSKETLEGLKKLKELKNENMQRILEVLEDGPSLYIVSEFIHGADLDEVISQRSSMSEEQAVLIFRRMVEALKTLHSNGIIHGNLRPEYFVLPNAARDDGTIKIIGMIRGLFHQDSPVLEYLAPEALTGKTSQSADIWACGVILYYLLTGSQPFKGTNPEETKAYIKRATPSFKAALWEGVSPYAKILLKMIFAKDLKNRPSLEDILKNNWVQGKVKFLDLSIPLPAKTFKDLKTYSSQQKLNQGLYLFLAKLIASNVEKEQALETFRQLDADMSGKLSRTEILSAFEYLHIELTEGELEGIIREIDVNMSGTVDYVEFLAAIITKRKSFSVEKLESVFRTFDTDNNGFITSAELKAVVGEGNWSEVIAQVDKNEDGKIDIKEFKNLLMTMLSSL